MAPNIIGLPFDEVIKTDFMYFNCIFYEIVVVIAVVMSTSNSRKKFFIMQFAKNHSIFRPPPSSYATTIATLLLSSSLSRIYTKIFCSPIFHQLNLYAMNCTLFDFPHHIHECSFIFKHCLRCCS